MTDPDFIEAYEQHIWDVYGFMAYRTRSRAEAEDLTQETFERALRGWASFDATRGQLRSWLLTIARNVYIDSRRRQSARPARVTDADLDEFEGNGDEVPLGPAPEIATALGRLGRREREALALRFGGDLRTSEIAAVMGISVANAQQILSRALRRLRVLLDAAD